MEKGVYAWDGSLLSNTPLREVIDASPVNDKQVFLVENYPKKCDSLPDHLFEIQHRARDIMFSDKTLHSIQMSKTITYYLRFIDELYHMIERELDSEKKEENKEKLKKIRTKYKKISYSRRYILMMYARWVILQSSIGRVKIIEYGRT